MSETVARALKRYGADEMIPDQFTLVEVLLDHGVNERELDQEDRPWQLFLKSRMVSNKLFDHYNRYELVTEIIYL